MDYCMITDKSEADEGDGDEADDDQSSSREPKPDAATEGEPVVEVDDAEEIGGDRSSTVLVMQESECRSVWAYVVQHKGASEEWVIDQIVEDLDTIGLRNDKIVIKSDQESSAADVSRAIAR